MHQLSGQHVRIITFASVCLLLAVRALGQPCDAQRWLPGEGLVGADNRVLAATRWDPDGAGPRGEVLVIGGQFRHIASIRGDGIAMWDPATGEWSAFGVGFSGEVRALVALPSGDLIAGGQFFKAGAVTVNHFARWNGQAWEPFGAGMSGAVNALVLDHSGRMIAGGEFSLANGSPAGYIARWDGTSWEPVGGGLRPSSRVNAIAVMPNGDIVAAGHNLAIAPGVARYVVRWDGSQWSELGTGIRNDAYAVAVLPDGDLVVGGNFEHIGSIRFGYIARWDGEAWSPMDTGFTSPVQALCISHLGTLIAAGGSQPGRTSVASWDGQQWTPVGGQAHSGVYLLHPLTDGQLVVGGDLDSIEGRRVDRIARWNGQRWVAMGRGFNELVHAVEVLPDGSLVVGGRFTFVGGIEAAAVARWDGTRWSALATSMTGPGDPPTVHDMAVTNSGDLIVSGNFDSIDSVAALNIARWDGTAWHPLGSGLRNGTSTNAWGYALSLLPNGDLVAAGEFTIAGGIPVPKIARWDGQHWSPIGSGLSFGSESTFRDTAVLPDGSLVAAGSGHTRSVRLWDGVSWHQLGQGPATVVSLFVDAAGKLHASTGGGVRRWNGTLGGASAWQTLGTGTDATALTQGPQGELLGGLTLPHSQSGGFVRWNNPDWGELWNDNYGAQFADFALTPGGELVAVGWFKGFLDQASPYFARFTFDGVPWIARQPQPVVASVGGRAEFSCWLPPGYPDTRIEWQFETAPGSDVFETLSEGLIPCTGEAKAIIARTESSSGTQAQLVIGPATASLDGRRVRLLASRACGLVPSDAALIRIVDACPADLTHAACAACACVGIPDGMLTDDDFFYYLMRFAEGNLAVADLTTTAAAGSPGYGTPDGVLNNDDFFYYLAIFAAGC